ncbi:LysR substrate-binding domain-containing protein [Nannocystis sp. ILAH1]|uniref:LysR family transcriptional regulator n=1 Tax=Nannocystis sp. ILAH1 TaxID=2996789 RepID=UPI00226D6CF9|nr:LysR substrate-binding domain-containing protein [Nannocystis sp. ILAH1]MCY0995003.1 LysR substrate-binding domain-containing protein [Nannocystis sp. ILAH1]
MIGEVTLDQLRVLTAVAEAGSFSAAAKRLRRVQSAVSQAIANLERQLDVAVFDRSTRVPTLTEPGKAILAAARRVAGEVDALRGLAAGIGRGLEPSVSLCVDALFPLAVLVALCREFAATFPTVALRVDTETMSAVSARVLAGAATLGVAAPIAVAPGLERRPLAPIRMIAVVAAEHPLAQIEGPIDSARLGEHVQVVLSERGATGVPDQAVLSPRTWRVADLHTKQALLRAGLGWGNLPAALAEDDLAAGRLVVIRPAAWAEDEHTLHLSAIHRADTILGPAHRWIVERLTTLCAGPSEPPGMRSEADEASMRARVSRVEEAGARRRRAAGGAEAAGESWRAGRASSGVNRSRATGRAEAAREGENEARGEVAGKRPNEARAEAAGKSSSKSRAEAAGKGSNKSRAQAAGKSSRVSTGARGGSRGAGPSRGGRARSGKSEK